MKVAVLLLAALAVAAHGQTPAADPVIQPVIQIDFSDPGLSPPQWTMTIHPDGTGHFRSPLGKPAEAAKGDIGSPAVDRDIQVSPAFAARVFEAAQRHNWFNEPCESHIKVAFQGWKTLTYTGPHGQGTCTFNFSKNDEIQGLGDSLEGVAQTVIEGARMELLLEHDKLGLDSEMEFLVDAVNDGRAQQPSVIHDILERLAQDESVLERVRKHARQLLARGDN